MYAKAKTKGKKGKATATANALKALQALETANVKEQEEKQKKKRKNGREGKADARANALKALQEIEGTPEVTEEKPKEEAKVQEEKVKEEAKVQEEEKPKEEMKVQEEEKPKEEMKVQEEEKPKEEMKVQEEEEKPKEEMKVQEEEKPKEEMKVQEEEKPKEEMKVQEEEPKEEVKTPGFADVLNSTNWDAAATAAPAMNVYQPGSDPFGEIQEIHEDMHRRRGGTNKKNMDDDDDELDHADYYARKGIQNRAAEWASMQEPLEEEDDDEEEVQPIKRRRGTDDQVDFSFLERGDVEGEVTVGIKEVAIRLGGRTVLQDASWTVKTGERLALVGANGCGKTTQLRILLGQLQADAGQVVRSPAGAKIAILEQSFVDDLNLENTLREELLAAVPQQKAIMEEKAQVEARLEENPEDPDEVQRLVERFNELQVQGEEFQVDKLDDILYSVAHVAGFGEEDMDRKVGLFSGGWKVRLGVCKIFMMRPDVLLLDEPTNHLDLQSVEWIENYMCAQDLPMVVVTHDREFMNRVCNRVVETVEGMTYSYEGNYTEFVKQKQAKMEKWRKNYDLQEKRKKELEDYIKKNKGNQSLAQARKQRAKELEDLKETGLDPPPAFIKRIKFRFPEPPKERRGGAQTEILAELRRVSHGYGTKDDEEYELLKDVDFMVTPGDKIGIVGGNGKGKSTLLRLLMGQESPRDDGTVRPADPNMTGFFAQHQADLLPLEKTGWEVVKEANEILMEDEKLKEIMKKFRFRGDRMNVQISNLSGGEKARLAIVRMMLVPSRLLVFDEPTNHLDVPMKETLEFALREYEGAVVVVSHDRWFLSQTCKQIVEVHDGQVKIYDGDYRFYMDSNNDVRRKVEAHYTGIDGLIESVPASLEERKKKERKGLRKNRGKKLQQERQAVIQSGFLQSREWRR